MTTEDVIAALLAAGWRWEVLSRDAQPVLTNAPIATQLCCGCGQWRPADNFKPSSANCLRCANAAARAYYYDKQNATAPHTEGTEWRP